MLTFEGNEFLGTQSIMGKITVGSFREELLFRALELRLLMISSPRTSSPPVTEVCSFAALEWLEYDSVFRVILRLTTTSRWCLPRLSLFVTVVTTSTTFITIFSVWFWNTLVCFNKYSSTHDRLRIEGFTALFLPLHPTVQSSSVRTLDSFPGARWNGKRENNQILIAESIHQQPYQLHS